MADTVAPYIPHAPGDLITAEDWNTMQVDIRQDIAAQVASGVAGVKNVDHATDSDQLGGKSLEGLTKSILDQVLAMLPKRTGYMQIFCNLKLNTNKLIQHNLKAFPVTDLYQLVYFPAVCANSDKPDGSRAESVLFYLYHADERRIRVTTPGSTTQSVVDIEKDPKFRILWKSLIDQLNDQKLLDYTDDTTLDDLEVDFWKALFNPPLNDEFDPDAYCHSPWFEKCCGEKRTVSELKKHGDFDDIYLKIEPMKTVNLANLSNTTGAPAPEPSNVCVAHLDFDTVGLRLLANPVYPTLPAGTPPPPEGYQNTLPVMLLLKV